LLWDFDVGLEPLQGGRQKLQQFTLTKGCFMGEDYVFRGHISSTFELLNFVQHFNIDPSPTSFTEMEQEYQGSRDWKMSALGFASDRCR
jgi:hypothetical protein